jgi:hypothetical protein
MANPCCPTCGRAYAKPRTAKPVAAPVDTSALSLDQLRAFYKRIGTREDARFWLRHAPYVPADLRVQVEALVTELETRDGRPADAKRLAELKRLAEPFYRQVCGHRHHTSLQDAYACKLRLKDALESEEPDVSAHARQTLYEALGWETAEQIAEC